MRAPIARRIADARPLVGLERRSRAPGRRSSEGRAAMGGLGR